MVKDGITIDKSSGSGNDTITISASVNEGLDTTTSIRISCSDTIYKDLTINREGRREIFVNDFILNDGTTFNVIKEGYE